MEGVKTAARKTVKMGENQINVSANKQVNSKKMKIKNKKKKRGQNKNQIVKPQVKNQEKVNLKKNIGKVDIKKPKKKEAVGEGQSNTDSEENMDLDISKTKKPKRRNNKDFKFISEKMELTALLTQETEGRTSHRDERTLYVRFPSSLSLQDKSFLEPFVPTAVDIRLPRLSPGNSAKFCYIEFESEEEAMRMKANLPNIKIKGEAFYADYVGKKSKAYDEKESRTVDPVRLYVGGLPNEINASYLRAAFPTATRVLYKKISHKVSVSHAYLIYATHEEALNVFKASKGLKILDKEVIVMFATYKNNANKNEEESITPAAKKQKTEDVKMEDE